MRSPPRRTPTDASVFDPGRRLRWLRSVEMGGVPPPRKSSSDSRLVCGTSPESERATPSAPGFAEPSGARRGSELHEISRTTSVPPRVEVARASARREERQVARPRATWVGPWTCVKAVARR